MKTILKTIQEMEKTDIVKADKMINEIYEKTTTGKLILTDDEYNYMFIIIGKISKKLYCK